MIDDNFVLLTGVTRSGTTILGKILGTFDGVEYEFEPWLLAQLAIMQGRKAISTHSASELLRGFIYETYYNALFGRYSNLRPSDDSYIWNCQPAENLLYKWHALRTRADAKKYASANNTKLLMKMPNIQEFYKFFFDVFPRMKIIHIVRNPFDVSMSMLKKHWLCDANFTNPEATFLRKCVIIGNKSRKRLIPWWVDDKDVAEFMKADEFSRGLIAWRLLNEKSNSAFSSLTRLQKKQFMECKYEDFLSDPEETVDKIAGFIGCRHGNKTRSLLKSVQRDKHIASVPAHPIRLSEKESSKLKSLMVQKGYDFSNISVTSE